MIDQQVTDEGGGQAGLEGPTPEGGAADVAAMVVLVLVAHELAELRMTLGLDADGSGAIDRLLGKLGAYEHVSAALAANGAAYDPSTRAVRARLRTSLRRQAPVIARLARA